MALTGDFPTQVNVQPAIGVSGDFASVKPRATVLATTGGLLPLLLPTITKAQPSRQVSLLAVSRVCSLPSRPRMVTPSLQVIRCTCSTQVTFMLPTLVPLLPL